MESLPEGHFLVLEILRDANRALTWAELRDEAARVGIGERELSMIMHGTPEPPSQGRAGRRE